MPRLAKPLRFLLLLLCAILFPPAAPRLWAQFQVGNIIGQARISRGGAPAEPIMIDLVARGAAVASTYTDGEGRFGFYAMPPNLYHLVVNDLKYQPVQVETKLNPVIAQVNIVNLILYPAEVSSTDSGAGPQPAASGGNPYMVDVADYAKDFPKKAVEEFEKALKADQQGKTDEAIRGYRKVLEMAPNFYPAHNQLGVTFLRQKNFPAAQGQFEEAIKLNQADANAYFNLGNVFLLTRQYDDAQRSLEEGLRKQPNSGLGHFLLGSVYDRMGKPNEAEHNLRSAIEFDATLSSAHLELVNLYLSQKRTPEAIAELKAFLKSFPADPFAPQARQVLSRLEGSPQPATPRP